MTDWIETRVEQVAAIRYGKALTSDRRRGGPCPVFGSSGRIGWHNRAMVDGPGIIVGRKGNIGKVFFSPGPFWPIDTTYHLVPTSARCDPRWLYYALQTMGLEELNEATACPGLKLDTLGRQRLRLPPLPRQRAAARLLGALDGLLDLATRQNSTLTSLIENVYGHIFIENPPPPCPPQPLSAFGTIVGGSTPPKDRKEFFGGGVPFIKIPDMRGNVFTIRTADTLTDSGLNPVKTIAPGSVCVSCLGTVGLVSMNVAQAQTNQQINSVVPFRQDQRHYLFCHLRRLSGTLATLASGSSVTPNLNNTAFSKIRIPIPDQPRLAAFNRRTAGFFRQILLNQKRAILLESLKDLLLPRLVDGSAGF
jgi:type I restriction enzyme S subunit